MNARKVCRRLSRGCSGMDGAAVVGDPLLGSSQVSPIGAVSESLLAEKLRSRIHRLALAGRQLGK